MWANQKQQENAFEIARQAHCMINLKDLADLIKIGKKIDETTEYKGAMNKLVGKGNLIMWKN
jgi:DNA recombination protein RmuC